MNLLLMSILLNFTGVVLAEFNSAETIKDWFIVNDGVMGGISQSRFYFDDEGYAVFKGTVSLENNGGFASVRSQFDPVEVHAYSSLVLRIKGDGKRYQFRIKPTGYERQSYISYFETSGDWEIITLSLNKMYPTFRGRRLNLPNFPGEQLAEIAFLIGNKKAESFQLEIDWIGLE